MLGLLIIELNLMSKFWSHFVKDLDPYIPGEQPQSEIRLKLNTNENPYPPSPKVIEEIQNHGADRINLYPDPESNILRSTIASYHDVDISNVFVGNGSDEILAFIFYGFFKNKKNLLFPDITYSFYPVYAKLFDISYQQIALNDDFEIDLSLYHNKNAAVIFPNPNAPTGIPISGNKIESFVQENPLSIIVVDEAYVDFGTDSSVNLVKKYKNLLITRSMSKSRSLAGLRVGYAVGDASLIDGLIRIKNSFNSYPLDRIAQKASVTSFQEDSYFNETCKKIIDTRNSFTKALESLQFVVLPSGGNFIFAHPPSPLSANIIYSQLRDVGVLIRYFHKPEKLKNFLRITIGTDQQMDLFLDELKKIINH